MSTFEPSHNILELSVSEISASLKSTIEESYGYVRVRGEISGFKRAPSGHLYMSLKDDKAVLAVVCWKTTALRLPPEIEDGLEVVCTGRMTTYGGQSKYQLIAESIEPAGVGALMALLEKRKKQLTKEGLFDQHRKKPLPFLPEVIGVVTSPMGAVIRDILHRLQERCGVHVLLWPVLVQGDKAATQIAEAIEGFNRLEAGGDIPRPDMMIVARGGGALEDLWAFNEEIVVRAVSNSTIPIISAVGHETDTTLIDYASDLRAPTPTAAAEKAVPVKSDLLYTLTHTKQRYDNALQRLFLQKQENLTGLLRGLPKSQRMMDEFMQRLDGVASRFLSALPYALEKMLHRVQTANALLISPHHMVMRCQERLAYMAKQLDRAMVQHVKVQQDALHMVHDRHQKALDFCIRSKKQSLNALYLSSNAPLQMIKRKQQQLEGATREYDRAVHYDMKQKHQRFMLVAKLLESNNYKAILKRGYVMVKQGKQPITSSSEALQLNTLTLEFHDGSMQVTPKGKQSKHKKHSPTAQQEDLFG